jgi:hypothetical protein
MAAGLEHRGALRGVGLAVVNQDGKLWVQKDLQDKPRTGRRRGDLSIIFETQKPDEPHVSNVLGALSELVDDTTLPQIAGSLYSLDGFRSTPRLTHGVNGSAISYVVATTVLDAAEFRPGPHDAEETEPVGWMSAAVLLDHDNVRPLARHAVGYLEEHDIIGKTLAAFRDPEHPRRLVVPSGHSISEFHQKREEVHDMEPGSLYQVAV